MVGVMESLRFIGDILTRKTLGLNLGSSTGSSICADIKFESRRRGDQDGIPKRVRIDSGDGDEKLRVASSMPSRGATNDTSTADARCERHGETYRISRARVDLD